MTKENMQNETEEASWTPVGKLDELIADFLADHDKGLDSFNRWSAEWNLLMAYRTYLETHSVNEAADLLITLHQHITSSLEDSCKQGGK